MLLLSMPSAEMAVVATARAQLMTCVFAIMGGWEMIAEIVSTSQMETHTRHTFAFTFTFTY